MQEAVVSPDILPRAYRAWPARPAAKRWRTFFDGGVQRVKCKLTHKLLYCYTTLYTPCVLVQASPYSTAVDFA
jgi:hypothetical protein